MLKKLALTAAIALLSACSSGGDNDNGGTVTPPVTPPTGGGGQPGTPTGTTEGSWAGTNDFGATYTIIDGNGVLYGFTDNGAGQFRSSFGNISGPLEQFEHRASDNPSLGAAYTVVGDPGPAVTYQFSVNDDGTMLNNSGAAGAFSLSLANVTNLSIADVVGNWESRTAFCADCPLTVNISIAADGALTGTSRFTFNGVETSTPLVGNVTGGGSFLGVQFEFNGDTRSGVLYSNSATGQLVMNTFGADTANNRNASFSALFSR